MFIKEQAALTALRDELRKVFEPFGARVDQFEVRAAGRSLRWRSRTPDYPSHHVGGAFEEWTAAGRTDRQHRIVVAILSDPNLLDAHNSHQHAEMFAGRFMPERISRGRIAEILRALGLELEDPIITVMAVGAIWNSR